MQRANPDPWILLGPSGTREGHVVAFVGRRDELAAVVTHRFPLDRIGDAFETIRSGAGLKIVMLP